MKSLALIVIAFAFSFYFFGCQVANESNINSPNSALEKKPPKGEKSELIIFTEDLVGEQKVVGCCPNRGPFPEYTMKLSDTFPEEIRGTHFGNVYMNGFHHRMPWEYKVQFWWGGENEYFLEIRGGVHEKDKKTRITTVTFTNESMLIIDPNNDSTYVDVTFTIIRDPLRRR